MPFGNAIPREVRDEFASLAVEFEGLRAAESERTSRYATYRAETEAARKIDGPNQRVQTDDYRKRVSSELTRHNISLPLAQALTVKHSYRIAGRLPDAVVDRREENAQERYRSDTMEKMWWSIVRESGADTLFASGAWHGSQLGASCFEVYFDPNRQMPIIRAIDPAGVFVVRGLTNTHDFQRVYRYWNVTVDTARSEYRDLDFRGMPVSIDSIESTFKTGNHEMVTIVQMADKHRSTRFALGKGGKGVPLWEWQHELGFVPYEVIPNVGPYDDVWGWADYEFYRGLVSYLPDLLSREADIIRMSSNGAMIDKGTGSDPKRTRRILGEGGIITSKKEGDLTPVQTPETPAFQTDHAQRAMDLLKMISFAPDAAWGDGGAGSGSDRGLQLQPLLELTAMKQTNWSAGLSKIAGMCFQMIEKLQMKPATYTGAKRSGTAVRPFAPFQLGPNLDARKVENPDFNVADPMSAAEIVLPRSPKELFAGDYQMRFFWQNRIDPDDASYVMSELNKFQQGAQSMRRTLERLGVENPEDEMKLIEEEADRFPWLRNGMIQMIRAQLQAQSSSPGQGAGGGAPVNPAGGLLSALGMMGTKDGAALDTDAGISALPGDNTGILSGGA